ncbi:MAG: LytTR family DNA-binding domain-containing protein [Steroidobacteraceae bacterium]
MTIPIHAADPAERLLDHGFLRLAAVAFLLLGAIFGLIQPAGSIALGRAGALAFWVLHGVAAVPCILAGVWLLARLPVRLSAWWFLLGSGLLAALLLSVFALGLEFLFGVEEHPPIEAVLQAPSILLAQWLDELGGLTPPFVLAWLLINLPQVMRLGVSPPVDSAPTSSAPPEASADPPPAVGLFHLLPPALGTDVVLLTADLHYLKVHTPRGRTMLLYSLSEAESELRGQGMRVHRSHWVADRHVLGLRRKGSGLVCQLSGGLEVPVSRRRQAEVLARYGRDTRYHPPES